MKPKRTDILGERASTMTRNLLASCPLIVALLGFCAPDGVAAQDASKTACFDVFVPSGNVQPILLNRCSGETWILARSGSRNGRLTYRWNPLVTTPAERPRAPESVKAGSGKCFSFQGRQFCE
jgi:hypothetical protein